MKKLTNENLPMGSGVKLKKELNTQQFSEVLKQNKLFWLPP